MKKIKTVVGIIMTLLCCTIMAFLLSKVLHKNISKPSGFFQEVNYPEEWR